MFFNQLFTIKHVAKIQVLIFPRLNIDRRSVHVHEEVFSLLSMTTVPHDMLGVVYSMYKRMQKGQTCRRRTDELRRLFVLPMKLTWFMWTPKTRVLV